MDGIRSLPQVGLSAYLKPSATYVSIDRTPPRWSRGIEGQRKADLGNGYYLNPIMAGDHPDPSILKDGGDYYMTSRPSTLIPGW